MISKRAHRLFDTPSIIFAAHNICNSDPYHSETNPDGCLNLGTAENSLVWDLLQPKISDCHQALAADSHYAPVYGLMEMREAISKFLNRTLKIDTRSDHFIVSNGSTAIIDMLAYSLCEEGECMLVPIPYYPGFDIDLSARAHVDIVPVNCHSRNDYLLTHENLKAAWLDAQQRDKKPRALLLTSPGNPVCRLLKEEELETALNFAVQYDLHCLVDEVYINSCFPDVESASAFKFLDTHPQFAEKLHVIYSSSKDFALCGYRIGFFYSLNTVVLKAMQQLSYFHSTSTNTQRIFTNMLADEPWVDAYFIENKKRLEQARRLFEKEFGTFAAISPADSGFLGWIDLSSYLKEPTFAAETALHHDIITKAKVNILPGQAFHSPEPGRFRVCYAHDPMIITKAASRIRKLLKQT